MSKLSVDQERKPNPALDPGPDGKGSADTSKGLEPDIAATPEGDNEFAPDQPLISVRKRLYGHEGVTS